jgi:hypothetical protein
MTTRVSTSLGGTGANSASAARSTLNVVSKTGDTMTGQLNITSGGLNVSAGGLNVSTGSLNVNFGTVNVANGSFFMRWSSSNTNANLFQIFNSENVMKTWMTDRGAQNWTVQDSVGAECGTIRYATPTGRMGILFFDQTGNGRSDLRHVAGGGLALATGATSGIPTEFIRLDANGFTGFGTTTPSANIHVTGTIIDSPIASITASATYAENGAGKVIFANTTSAVTVTVANSATSGFSYTVVRGNSGNVTIANSSAVTRLNSTSISSMNVSLYGAITVLYTATNQVVVFGDFV